MLINYWAVLTCAVLSMIIGTIWFGPLFGKKWTEIICASNIDEARRKEMQKSAMPLYLLSFILTFFQVYVLAHFAQAWRDVSSIESSVWIWAAFIIPTVAAGAMWNADSAKVSWARFFIQAGYYLVLFIIFGLVLGFWK